MSLNYGGPLIRSWANPTTVTVWTANQTYNDDVLFRLGTDGDGVLWNNSAALAADEEVTNGIVGTSDHQATAANSVVLSNITANGDILGLVNNGGNSIEWLLVDASALTLHYGFGGFTTQRWYASAGVEAMRINSDEQLIIGDGTTTGYVSGNGPAVIVSQGASDGNSVVLKSSDVATVLTTGVLGNDVQTDDYGAFSKLTAGGGGLRVKALAESTLGQHLFVESYGGAPDTTDTSGSTAALQFYGALHDGANGLSDFAANANLFAVGEIDSGGSTLARMVLKADDGELHLGNTTLVALDEEDDIQLVRAMQKAGAASGIRETQYDNPFYDYNKLRDLGLAGEMDEEGFFLFPLQSRLHAHEGAMWQMYCELQDTKRELAETRELIALGGK